MVATEVGVDAGIINKHQKTNWAACGLVKAQCRSKKSNLKIKSKMKKNIIMQITLHPSKASMRVPRQYQR